MVKICLIFIVLFLVLDLVAMSNCNTLIGILVFIICQDTKKSKLKYQTKSHAESEKATRVSNEPDDGDLLIALDAGHDGVLDVDVDQGHVALGVTENLLTD